MPLKKVSSKEFIKIVKKDSGLDLSKPSITIHVGPFYKRDFDKKDFNKSKLIDTQGVKKDKKN